MRVRTEHWELLLDFSKKMPELSINKFNEATEKVLKH